MYIEQLEESVGLLKSLLSKRSNALTLLEKRAAWETELASIHEKVASLANQLWDFVDSGTPYDFTAASEVESNGAISETSSADELLQSLKASINAVQESMERASHYGKDLSAGFALVDMEVPIFVQTEQNKYTHKVQDLGHLLAYALELSEQRKALSHAMSLGEEAKALGSKLLDNYGKYSIHVEASEDNNNASSDETTPNLEDQKESFRTSVQCFQEASNLVPHPVPGQWLRQTPSSSDNNDKVNAIVQQAQEELSTLDKMIDKAGTQFEMSRKVNTLATQYAKEAEELYLWVETQIKRVKECHVDVTTETFNASEADLKALQQQNQRFTDDRQRFKNDQFLVLQASIAEIDGQRQGQELVDLPSLAKVADGLAELEVLLSSDAVNLRIALSRTRLQRAVETGMKRLQEMNEYIRQFITTKNNWMAQDEITDKQLLQLTSDLSDIAVMQQMFDQREMPQDIRTTYAALADQFSKQQENVPEPVEARMESVRKTLSRFRTMSPRDSRKRTF